jgi:hypothetical protein
MGYEIKCRVRVDDRSGRVREADATVLIETDDVIVRGEARVRIPRASIERVTSRGGGVTFTAPGATVSLTLGNAAETWRKRLEEAPKRLIDKLDVKPGAKVWLLGAQDPTLESQLAERTTQVVRGVRASACSVAFVGVESTAELDRIDRALAAIEPAGSIWVVHRKGASGVADTAIFARARELGLTYTKVARVSDTHTAEKLVRPVASRSTVSKKTAKR